MTVDFTIPAWLLWGAGILAAGFVLGMAAIGGLFVWSMRNFRLF